MSRDASELYMDMWRCIDRGAFTRTSTDPSSPQLEATAEAELGCAFRLLSPAQNVVSYRSIDLRWAVANVLHFFAATERAAALKRYNATAARFLEPDGQLIGAYGAIAMPQLLLVLSHLREHPTSRRGIITMGPFGELSINKPACWSALHLLQNGFGELDALVYQRSLHLYRVMPYDCILLTNVLLWAAHRLKLRVGSLHWMLGSLHMSVGDPPPIPRLLTMPSIVLPPDLLSDCEACYDALMRPGLHKAMPLVSLLDESEARRT